MKIHYNITSHFDVSGDSWGVSFSCNWYWAIRSLWLRYVKGESYHDIYFPVVEASISNRWGWHLALSVLGITLGITVAIPKQTASQISLAEVLASAQEVVKTAETAVVTTEHAVVEKAEAEIHAVEERTKEDIEKIESSFKQFGEHLLKQA